MRKYAGISFADKGHRSPLRLTYRFACKKRLNPAYQMDLFYKAKFDISKIVAFEGGD
jgi:hypothetical protein